MPPLKQAPSGWAGHRTRGATVADMQAACSFCGMLHVLNDAQVGGHAQVQFRCSRCGKSTIVQPRGADSTQVLSPLPEFARSGGGPAPAALLGADLSGLFLPPNKAIFLSVISGPDKGQAFVFEKPLVVVGRSGADFTLQDANISRWHCAVEVRGDVVRLRDLDSTNGTFVGEERIRAAQLRHLSEFHIGSSVVLLTITPKLASPR
jgi:ribosomal protein S27E